MTLPYGENPCAAISIDHTEHTGGTAAIDTYMETCIEHLTENTMPWFLIQDMRKIGLDKIKDMAGYHKILIDIIKRENPSAQAMGDRMHVYLSMRIIIDFSQCTFEYTTARVVHPYQVFIKI
jgi:hypothetical protein